MSKSATSTESAADPQPFDDFDFEYEEPDLTCKNCSGTGGEPYDDGITRCEECDGEGYYWWLH